MPLPLGEVPDFAGLKDKHLHLKPGDFSSDSICDGSCGTVGKVLCFSLSVVQMRPAFFLESLMPPNEIYEALEVPRSLDGSTVVLKVWFLQCLCPFCPPFSFFFYLFIFFIRYLL